MDLFTFSTKARSGRVSSEFCAFGFAISTPTLGVVSTCCATTGTSESLTTSEAVRLREIYRPRHGAAPHFNGPLVYRSEQATITGALSVQPLPAYVSTMRNGFKPAAAKLQKDQNKAQKSTQLLNTAVCDALKLQVRAVS